MYYRQSDATYVNASYRDIAWLLSKREQFQGNSMRAEWDSGVYMVYSYSTLIAISDLFDSTRYLNEQHYSSTTARQQTLVDAWLDAHFTTVVARGDYDTAKAYIENRTTRDEAMRQHTNRLTLT